ncbi:hypothetical protein NS2_00930 [Nocardia seriolae NBRC 15557]|nr:hypothetical protein NS2_00930 [Nocardia seriolae NBRC 15557]
MGVAVGAERDRFRRACGMRLELGEQGVRGIAGGQVQRIGQSLFGHIGPAQRGVVGEHRAGALGEQVAHRTGGAVPGEPDQRALGGIEQVDIADRQFRTGRDGRQQAGEALTEGGHGRCVEKVRRIDQFGGDTGRGRTVAVALARADLLGQHQLEVELGGVDGQLDRADGQAGQFQFGDAGVLERQHDLEQRVPGLRADRVEDLDQALEGQVGVAEGLNVGAAHRVQEFGEAAAPVDLGAQHQGVDEHADQVVEGAFTTTGDRGADGDVLLARQARQQHGQCGMHDHEQGRAAGAREFGQLGMGFGVDGEDVGGTVAGGHGRTRPIRGQVQLVGQPGQRVAPVRDLLRDHRFGVALVTQHRALPQRVVGVLDIECLPARFAALDASAVGGHDVPGERAHGEAVGRDVVHHQREHVLGGADLEQPGPEGHVHGDVEAGQHQLRKRLRQLGFGDLDRGQVRDDLPGGHDLLERLPVDLGVAGAQRLVPRQHVGDGDLQGLAVHQTRQAHGRRDVVHGRFGIEPVEEPHALLGQRQRQPLRPVLRHQRLAGARAGMGFGPRRERGHGRGLEDLADTQLGVQRRGQSRRHLGGDERVAAEREEVVVQADPVQSEDLGEHTGHDLLDRGGRGAEHRGLEHRCGQRLAVQLAGGVEREFVQHHQDRRHHVRRHALADLGAHLLHVHGVARGRNDVADQLITGVRVVAHHDHRLRDGIQCGERGFDLAELDAQTAQLHLEVGAADVLDLAVRGPGDEVTGAVHALGVPEGVGHEAIRGQVRSPDIAARQLDARQVQLTRDADRHRPQSRIQHVHLGVEHRAADRHRVHVGVHDLVVGDVDGGLGGAVQVVQLGPGQFAQLVRGLGRQRFTGGEDHAQAGAARGGFLGDEHREHGRHEVADRDALAGNEIGEVGRVAVALGLGDDQLRADLQRPEELPHRHVEGGRGLLDHHIVSGQTVFGLHPQQAVDNGRVRHRHALGPTGRTGSEDDVGGVRIPQRGTAIRVGDRLGRVAGEIQQVDAHLRGVDRQILTGGQRGHRVGGLENVLGALGRVIGIQRHVGGTGHGDRVHADHQIDGAPHTQRHKRFRADTALDEPAPQTVHPLAELGVGQTCPLEADRDRVGRPCGLRLEQRDQRRGGGTGRLGRGEFTQDRLGVELGPVPQRHNLFTLGGIDEFDIAHGRGGLGGDGGQHAEQAIGDAPNGVLVEQVAQVTGADAQAAVELGDEGERVVGGVGGVQAGDGHAVDIGGLGPDAVGVNGIRLEHDQGVEESADARGRLDVGQAHVVVVQQVGLLALGAGEQRARRLGRIEGDPHRDGVDEQAHHGFDAGQLGRAAGDGGAEQHVLAAGEAAEQDAPGDLEHGVRGDADFGGQRGQA